MYYFKNFLGLSKPLPPRPSIKSIGFIWLGACLACCALGILANFTQSALVLGSFGASIFVLFILPDTPFAQPRNVIDGHFISTLIGLICFHCIGTEWWSMALALPTAIAFMQLLQVQHPPAGSNPIIVFLVAANWEFLLTPTLIGSIIIVIVALFYNNLPKEKVYPTYWF